MPALSSAASTLPFQPGVLIPPSVTAREPSTVGLPGPPTICFLARNSATSKATKTIAEPIRILDFLFIVGPQSKFRVVTVGHASGSQNARREHCEGIPEAWPTGRRVTAPSPPEASNAVAAIINLLSFVIAAERTLRLAAIVRASLSRSIISVPAVRHRKV